VDVPDEKLIEEQVDEIIKVPVTKIIHEKVIIYVDEIVEEVTEVIVPVYVDIEYITEVREDQLIYVDPTPMERH